MYYCQMHLINLLANIEQKDRKNKNSKNTITFINKFDNEEN